MVSSTSKRVVITGVGLVCPLGNSADAMWDAMMGGRSGVEPLGRLPTENLPTKFGGEARYFTGNIDEYGPLEKTVKRTIKKAQKVMCREIEMGVAAAQLALTDAGLSAGSYDPDRMGTMYGSDYITTMPEEFTAAVRKCLDEEGNFDFSRWGQEGMHQVTPLWLLKYLPNMPASHIAIYNDLRGPSNSVTVREASSMMAIGEAYHTIQRDWGDMMVAGATGTRIHPLRTVHVCLQEELATNGEPAKACRPFDQKRSGMVLGEGAGAIILESLEAAEARGAKILGEIVGHGSATAVDRQGVAMNDVALKNAMASALRTAGMSPAEIGHVNAHGLATRKSDAEESRAINGVFGQRSDPVPVSAAKSYFGNMGAGGGVVELIASLIAMQQGQVFPTLNYETPDPECAVAVVDSSGTPAGESFLKISVTPQGQASAVVVRKFV